MKTKPTIATFIVYLPLAAILGLLFIPERSLAASISCGQTVTNATTQASENDFYTFTGTAGQVISLSLWSSLGYSYGHPMVADIYVPGGTNPVATASANDQPDPGSSGGAVNLTLTNSGTYTIVVHDSAYVYTSSYALSLQTVNNGGCVSTPISCGQTLTTNTSFNSEMDAYSFTGSAGQVISLSLWSAINNPYGCPMVVDVYSPSGQLLTTATANRQADPGSAGGAVNLTLTNSGAYTVLVHDANYVYTGSYALSLQTVNNGGCVSTTISCGQTLTTNTSFNSEMDAYSFTGSAGQVISLSLWSAINNPYGCPMVADVYSPSGQLLTTATANRQADPGSAGGAVNLTLTNSGAYTVLVHDENYVYTSSYSLSLQSVNNGGCVSTPISCGQTLTTNTSFNSEMDGYIFTGSAGQVVSVSLWSAFGNPYGCPMVADIYSPSGQLLTTATANWQEDPDSSGGAVNLTLTNNGFYTVLVHDENYVYTSSYSLSLQSVNNGGCVSTPISCGQTLTTNTSFNSEMDGYIFTGSAGQVVSVSLWSAFGNPYGCPMVADIYSPSGQLLTTATANWQEDLDSSGGAVNLTLTNNGFYTILVHDENYVYTSSYALSLQSVNTGGCNGITIPCGQTINGQISLVSQMNGYELVANAGEQILLSNNGFSGMVVDIYDPTGTNVASMGASTSVNITLADMGIYTVVVHSGNYIGTGSYSLDLNVFGGCADLPIVYVTPTNLVVASGSPATFTAAASGPTPLYYQWLFNNAQLMGATNTTYSIASVQTNNLGDYMVVVSNPGGAVTSAPPALLLFNPNIAGSSLSRTNLVISGINGYSGEVYHVLMSTNVTLPLSQWTPVATNVLNVSGNFTITVTNTVTPGTRQRFYILQLQ